MTNTTKDGPPSPPDLREQVARIVDPRVVVWEGFAAEGRARIRALSKADTIIALVTGRLEGEKD